MRVRFVAIGVAILCVAVTGMMTQAQGDPDRVIPGGGVLVSGWTGKIDVSRSRAQARGRAVRIRTASSSPATTWAPLR
jgi:hypothetical protein